jgi:Caspase domain
VLFAAGIYPVADPAEAQCTPAGPPAINVISMGGQVFSGDELNVAIMPTAGAQLTAVSILVDNQSVFSVPAAALTPQPDGWVKVRYKYEVGNLAGTIPLAEDTSGSMRVQARDSSGACAESAARSWHTGSTDTFAVIIGINEYPHANAKLSFARQDAEEIARYVLKNKNFDVSAPDRIYLLTDYPWVPTPEHPTDDLKDMRSEATRDNIVDALSDLYDRVDTNGRLIFFFAGHGFATTDDSFPNSYYLLTRDSSTDRDTKMLSVGDIALRMSKTRAAEKVLIFDACFSDRFVAGYSAPLTATMQGGRALSGTIANQGVAAFIANRNVYVMTAGTDDDLAYEVPQLGHGVFTDLLLKAYETVGAGGTEMTMLQAFTSAASRVSQELPQGTRQRPNHYVIGRGDKIIWWRRPAG